LSRCCRRVSAPATNAWSKPEVTELIASDRRSLELRVLRYNPLDPNGRPAFQSYFLEEADAMTLFIALNDIRENQDPGLQFDFVCRAGICGSCGMLINGKPGLACRTLTRDLGPVVTLAPLPGFELIADLSVNTGRWMRAMSERLETWVHSAEPAPDIDRLEAPMEPELAQEIYELERCIECGCCIAACGTVQMREDFAGAVGLNKLARLRLDPRDQRSDADFYELVGDENGVFGCMSLLACEDSCPKNLPLSTQIAWLRRRMLAEAL
jgi:fumarate reductase iron-sulfur subunit